MISSQVLIRTADYSMVWKTAPTGWQDIGFDSQFPSSCYEASDERTKPE
jgi:hypothetical protein